MALPLVTGTTLQCSMGLAPSVFNATPAPGAPLDLGAAPTATVEQMVPMTNILPFGMCQSMGNPQVASATAAAQGVLTPMPCVPVTTAPWTPPAVAAKVNGLQLATVNSKCLCSYGGVISVAAPLPGPLDVT